MTQQEIHELCCLEGMFVGLLSEAELRLFERAVDLGYARRGYEGAAGLMGLARVRLRSMSL